MSEHEALQPIGQNKIAEGLGDEVFLRPSILEMVQRSSKKVTDPNAYGKLRDTLTGALYNSVSVIPLRFSTTRVYFQPGADFGSDPLCRSDNGIVPSQFVIAKQSDDCATCDKSKWGMNGERPDCKEQKRLLFLMEDSALPYVIDVRGTSIRPMVDAMKGIFRDIIGFSRREAPTFLQLYDWRFDLKPTMVEGKRGTYYVLNVMNIQQISTPGKYADMYQQFTKFAREQQDRQQQEQLTAQIRGNIESEVINP